MHEFLHALGEDSIAVLFTDIVGEYILYKARRKLTVVWLIT